jgi:hypothetical protein
VAGDLNVALATANESVELDEDMEPGPYSAAAGAALASTLLETGKPTGASTCCSRVPGRGTPADRRRLAGAIPRGADLGAGQPAAAAKRALAATAALQSVAARFDAARAGMRGTSTYSRQPTATVRPLSSSSPQQHSAPSACFGTATRQRELRKLGRHIHRRRRPGTTGGSGTESLTQRELQVARPRWWASRRAGRAR